MKLYRLFVGCSDFKGIHITRKYGQKAGKSQNKHSFTRSIRCISSRERGNIEVEGACDVMNQYFLFPTSYRINHK